MKKNTETPDNEIRKEAELAANDINEEMDEGELKQIAGAGDPFGGIPRVKPKNIDTELRENGWFSFLNDLLRKH